MASSTRVSDAVAGLLLGALGVVVVVAGVLRWLPSTYALAGIALASGAVAVGAALATRSGATFWTALAAGATLVTFGGLALRFAGADARALAPLLAGVFVADAVVRLGACRELVALGPQLAASGLLSAVMAALVLTDAVPAGVASLGTLLGCSLVVTAGTLVAIGVAERPRRR